MCYLRFPPSCGYRRITNPGKRIILIKDSFIAGDAIFRALVDSAPYGVVVVGQQGHIVLVNLQTEKLFGYTRAELTNQPIEILIPEQFRHKHPARLASYVHRPQLRPMGAGLELYERRKDGNEFPVEISLRFKGLLSRRPMPS
jgi:PAS domain S-box-containing protein